MASRTGRTAGESGMAGSSVPVRVILLGGTSNTGKSTIGSAVASELGFEYRSTDHLARHPGRPWARPDWEVPPHVAEHYRSLSVDELVASVLDHYTRLWPRIESLIAQHADGSGEGLGLVLEGSALLPNLVARITVPGVVARWLIADDEVIRGRIRSAGLYAEAGDDERLLMDKFTERSLRFQSLIRTDIARLGLTRIDAGVGKSVLKPLVEEIAQRPSRNPSPATDG
jgi:2-phosphoglycerate kinase